MAFSEVSDLPHTGRPISVITMGEDIKPLAYGPPLVEKCPSRPEDFWEYLNSMGGSWMWEEIGTGEAWNKNNLTWLVDGMKNGTLILVADGSYDRKRAPNVSGAGWVIYCTQTQRLLRGFFYELSDSASSYRAEQLGILALLHLSLALEEFYDVKNWHGKLCCDNQSALYQASKKLIRIRPGAKGADILRNMRTVKQQLTARFKYEHVDGHMDRILLWHQLPLINKLNCICDQLAKRSVARSINDGFDREGSQTLPREDVSLYVDGVKLTSDVSDPIRFELSKLHAKEFLLTQGWTPSQFEEVAWDWLHASLANKPDMYKIWLSKQHTNHCATRVQVSYYNGDNTADVGCPNCGDREVAGHLCLCPNEDRTKLLWDQTKELEQWMNTNNNTNAEIAYWLPKYILYRGTKKFADLGPMSRSMRALATSQDEIGWRNFMEGRLTSKFYGMQHYHLTLSASYLNGGDWMKQCITKVLHITHSQWIFRNFSYHDKRLGVLARRNKAQLLMKIEDLAHTMPEDLPEDSKFLLEFDFNKLVRASTDTQEYWVVAIEAAKVAGRRIRRQGRRERNREARRKGTLSRRKKLRLGELDLMVRRDFAFAGSLQQEQRDARLIGQRTITSYAGKRPHPAHLFSEFRSNKRLCNPD